MALVTPEKKEKKVFLLQATHACRDFLFLSWQELQIFRATIFKAK